MKKHRLLPTCLEEASKGLQFSQLKDWGLLSVSGPDALRYLQTQLTCDLTLMQQDQWIWGGHCNEWGKLVTTFYLFEHQQQYLLLQRRSTLPLQQALFTKYALFSKVSIQICDEYQVFGLWGAQATAQAERFLELSLGQSSQTLWQRDQIFLLAVPLPDLRYLLVLPKQEAAQFAADLTSASGLGLSFSDQWRLLDMLAYYPILEAPQAGEWIPQALNLNRMKAISLNKGCYLGQEVIARAHYRQTVRQQLALLIGQSMRLPRIGEPLEIQHGDTWRSAGAVLSALQLPNQHCYLQAVVSDKHLKSTAVFRVYQAEESLLSWIPSLT